jgi:hypothetical protein
MAKKNTQADCMRGVQSTPRQTPYQNTNPRVGDTPSPRRERARKHLLKALG